MSAAAGCAALRQGILHVLLFGLVAFAFEQGHIEFTEAPVELQPEKLRIPSAIRFLGKGGGICIDITDAGTQEIAAGQGDRCRIVLQELVSDRRIHTARRPVVTLGITAGCTAAAAITTLTAGAGAAAGRQFRLGRIIAADL